MDRSRFDDQEVDTSDYTISNVTHSDDAENLDVWLETDAPEKCSVRKARVL